MKKESSNETNKDILDLNKQNIENKTETEAETKTETEAETKTETEADAQTQSAKKPVWKRALGKIGSWIKANKIVTMYAIYAILIEMIAVFAVENNPFITSPYIIIGLLLFASGIALLFKSNKVKFLFCSILLIVQAVVDLVFVVVFDMTGQYFDYGMLNLRNDAFGILESIPMNFIAFYSAVFFCAFFFIYGTRVLKNEKTVEISKKSKRGFLITILAGFLIVSGTLYMNNSEKVDKYSKLLLNKQRSNYSSLGIVGNMVNEFSKGMIFNKTEFLEEDEVDSFIYDQKTQPTVNFGVSKNKNVIVMLVESFEWFSFVKSEEYPNGLDLSKEDLEYLFPNLTKFYGESVVMNNFHSKEKTDISETISILGSYPTDAYVDYDFENNTIPYTVPNILKQEDNSVQCKSFHDGFKSFYNREKTHKIFGFENLTDSYDMYDISDDLVKSGKANSTTMHDYMTNGERNLDSEMINTCKDMMFPTNKRFFTYITTITMHGMYYERDNLSKYMDKLKEVYTPKDKDDSMEQTLMNYVTTVMEFDYALGVMMDDLQKKGLLDNTTILMFGDHNCYYQRLSNYVKDIDDYDTDRYYPDLYKVPLMIYDKDLGHQVIDKFTCTADIAPTLIDLLGINTYSNMYYGNSVFSDKQSVLYSRAYGFFLGEGVVGRSINSLLYKNKDVTDDYMKQFDDEAAVLVNKIKFCDQIFYQDYFKDEDHYNKYVQKLQEIN